MLNEIDGTLELTLGLDELLTGCIELVQCV